MHLTSLPAIVGLAVAGLGVGLAASLSGLGGGFLMVPLLLFLGLPPAHAVGTSFAAIVVISAAAVYSHARHGAMTPRVGILLGLGGAIGAQLGAPLLTLVPGPLFRPLFALLLALLALRMALGRAAAGSGAHPSGHPRPWLRDLAFVGAGVGIGVAAAMTGLGGGFLMVPLAILLGLSLPQAVGTSLVAILVIALSAVVAHARLGDVDWAPGLALGLGGAFGAQLGPPLLRRISVRRFRQLFALALGLLALRLVF